MGSSSVRRFRSRCGDKEVVEVRKEENVQDVGESVGVWNI